mgnify:CR=1 FL=1
MIENLKFLLSMMKENSIVFTDKTLKDCKFSLECAIEILEKLRNEERSIQNGNIE